MTIRKFTPADYNAAYSLWTNTPGVAVREYDDSEPQIVNFLKRNPDTSFVAEENGTLTGTIMGGNDGRRGYIYHLAVAEKSRGQGLGKILTLQTIDALVEQGIAKIALFCLNENIGGNAFWEKLGFEIMDEAITWAKRYID